MKRRAPVLALLALIGVTLAACGEPGPRENVVRVGISLEPPHLDPTSGAAAATDEIVYANVFEGLTRIGAHGEVIPALAERWEASPDGLTFTFHLRRNVTFHDGTAFDANDVKFSLDRARAPESTNAQKGAFEPITAVDVLDAETVRVTLSHPVADFPRDMGWGDAVIVAPESAANNAVNPIGTGPFAFSRWLRGAQIELTRYPTYWGKTARIEKIVFLIVPDPAAAYAALLAGDVDSFPNFPAVELLPQIQGDPRFAIVTGTTEGETILAINNGRKPFDDLRVRQAISHALDRKAIILAASEGYGTPIGSHFPPHDKAYIDLTGTYPYDLDAARKLLAEAGYPKGFAATLRLPPVAYARRGGEVIAQELRAIGIDVRIENIEWAQWLDQVYGKGDFDLTIVSHTEPRDIDIYAKDGYYFHYRNPAFNALMAALQRATDDGARTRILQDAQRLLANDAVNGFLFQLPKIGVWNVALKGQWADSPVQANDLTSAYWEDR
jgi:peptide/nickel transport system substrate-binding protein